MVGEKKDAAPASITEYDHRDQNAWMYSFGAAMIPFTAFCYGHSKGVTVRVVERMVKSPFGVYGLLALPFVTLGMEKCIYDTVQSWQGINPNVRPKDRGGFPSGGAELGSKEVNLTLIHNMMDSGQYLALLDLFESTGMYSSQSNPYHNWFQKNVHTCSFTGVTCNEQGFVTDIRLDGKGLTGTVPNYIHNNSLHFLERLSLGNNDLTGTIPPSITSLTNLITLNLEQNSLDGTIPDLPTRLKHLYLNGNNFHGNLPSSICWLKTLDISFNNQLRGSLPSCLSHSINLNLLNTGLVGTVPKQVCQVNKFGCDGVACSSGTYRHPHGKQINEDTPCLTCLEPSNTLGMSDCLHKDTFRDENTAESRVIRILSSPSASPHHMVVKTDLPTILGSFIQQNETVGDIAPSKIKHINAITITLATVCFTSSVLAIYLAFFIKRKHRELQEQILEDVPQLDQIGFEATEISQCDPSEISMDSMGGSDSQFSIDKVKSSVDECDTTTSSAFGQKEMGIAEICAKIENSHYFSHVDESTIQSETSSSLNTFDKDFPFEMMRDFDFLHGIPGSFEHALRGRSFSFQFDTFDSVNADRRIESDDVSADLDSQNISQQSVVADKISSTSGMSKYERNRFITKCIFNTLSDEDSDWFTDAGNESVATQSDSHASSHGYSEV